MLVTVIVATYNCAHYIEETLNSVFQQTYKEIELVVSDDCSQDDTVKLTSQWINNHKERFLRVCQTHTTKNSGVTVNYNVGLKEATGEWIKCLDGDDMLTEDAIETYVNHCISSPQYPVWYAHEKTFFDNNDTGSINKTLLPKASARKQIIHLLNHRLLGICTATNFIHRKTFLDHGGFDNRYPMYQDGSPFLQVLSKGKQVGVIDRILLLKRNNPQSLMHTANPTMVENIRECHYYYSKYYLHYGMFLHYYNVWVTHFISTHDNAFFTIRLAGHILRCFDLVNLFRKIGLK